MDHEVFHKLKKWRDKQAKIEGVELYRVLPNSALSELATHIPHSSEDLLEIKGIGEKKLAQYGKDILEILEKEAINDIPDGVYKNDTQDEGDIALSVSEFLNHVNSSLVSLTARIRGEVSSLNLRNNFLFFSIQDDEDGSLLNCFMWANNYELCGVELQEGVEIVVHGYPRVHKPSGRLSLQVDTIELVGEGVLKQAYERLRQKLESEGLFDPERKKLLQPFPQAIGIITSREGAVIHDFLNNIGRFGFHIHFLDSRVEGQQAVHDIVSSLRTMKKRKLDALVIMRGGGSLESLQAFNNETVVRELVNMPFPVVCGIGHHQDAPLASLVADIAVSTPTAVAHVLSQSWEKVRGQLDLLEYKLVDRFASVLSQRKKVLYTSIASMQSMIHAIIIRFEDTRRRYLSSLNSFENVLHSHTNKFSLLGKALLQLFSNTIDRHNIFIGKASDSIRLNDPKRALRLGYSIVRGKEGIIRSVDDVKKGDSLEVVVHDGQISTVVTKNKEKE